MVGGRAALNVPGRAVGSDWLPLKSKKARAGIAATDCFCSSYSLLTAYFCDFRCDQHLKRPYYRSPFIGEGGGISSDLQCGLLNRRIAQLVFAVNRRGCPGRVGKNTDRLASMMEAVVCGPLAATGQHLLDIRGQAKTWGRPHRGGGLPSGQLIDDGCDGRSLTGFGPQAAGPGKIMRGRVCPLWRPIGLPRGRRYCKTPALRYNQETFDVIVHQVDRKSLAPVAANLPVLSYLRGWRPVSAPDRGPISGRVSHKAYRRQPKQLSGERQWFLNKPVAHCKPIKSVLSKRRRSRRPAAAGRLSGGYVRALAPVITNKESQVLVVPGSHYYCMLFNRITR
jgi:hypothetical protein